MNKSWSIAGIVASIINSIEAVLILYFGSYMKKVGGIIGLVAGIFGFLTSTVTLIYSNYCIEDAECASREAAQGSYGFILSLLCFTLGIVVLRTKGKLPGILLTLSGIAGAVLGGRATDIGMAFAFFGGILAMFGAKRTIDRSEAQ